MPAHCIHCGEEIDVLSGCASCSRDIDEEPEKCLDCGHYSCTCDSEYEERRERNATKRI